MARNSKFWEFLSIRTSDLFGIVSLGGGSNSLQAVVVVSRPTKAEAGSRKILNLEIEAQRRIFILQVQVGATSA